MSIVPRILGLVGGLLVVGVAMRSTSGSSGSSSGPPPPPGTTRIVLAPNAPTMLGTPSPAAQQALRDATARWPRRSTATDGIMGDARHQAGGTSDHNIGNAFDLTHDPAAGVDGAAIAAAALRDARTSYVIWNGRIWNTLPGFNDAIDGPGREYPGDPHKHHVHVSIRAEARDQIQPWPWAPDAAGVA